MRLLSKEKLKINYFSNTKAAAPKIPASFKFDLIIFNPPYLPLEEKEPLDSQLSTTGGKKGNEILIRFLSQAKKHLNKNGKILIVFSSLTPSVNKIIKKYNFKFKKLDEEKIDFETLYLQNHSQD